MFDLLKTYLIFTTLIYAGIGMFTALDRDLRRGTRCIVGGSMLVLASMGAAVFVRYYLPDLIP